jgi:hypothetical protein
MGDSAKKGNWNLALCALVAVLCVLLWLTNCSGKGDGNTVIETKEVNGGFKTVYAKDIKVKAIPTTSPKGQNVSSQNVSNTKEFEKFKILYNLTQKQLDSLLVVNRTLDSLANASNDKRYQELYSNCKFIEFKHEFNNDTINITLTGLSRGAPQNLDLNYKIKSRKDTIQLKQLLFRVFAGAEVGINKELNQGTYKVNLTIQNAKNDLISASYQRILNQNFYLVGYNKALFTINKRAKKK